MRRVVLFCVLPLLLLTAITSFSQQSEIKQFSIIAGYSYLDTPSLNLAQRGFNGDMAVNVKPWMSIGFDFSCFSGHNTIVPSYLSSAAQANLSHLLPPGVPASMVAIPTDITTYTYQLGPQLNYRRFRQVTLFVRPALGLLHAKAQTKPTPPTAPLVRALMGGLSSADTVPFYGFGGGATWEINPRFGIRATADLARFNFFSDQLNGTRTGLRLSITTKYNFGKNIMGKM